MVCLVCGVFYIFNALLLVGGLWIFDLYKGCRFPKLNNASLAFWTWMSKETVIVVGLCYFEGNFLGYGGNGWLVAINGWNKDWVHVLPCFKVV